MTLIPHEQEERFWAFVERSDGCWEWRGCLNYKGYARFPVGPRGARKYLRAYCIAWEIEHSLEWPQGYMACHSCDNPRCVNPYHIRPGTAADNSRDNLERRRHPEANKTHCINGHALSGDNLIIRRQGWRACRACSVERKAKFRARRSA